MNAEEWRQVDRIFHEALDREPGERARFVEEACAALLSCHGGDALARSGERAIARLCESRSVVSVRQRACRRFGRLLRMQSERRGEARDDEEILGLFHAGLRGVGGADGTRTRDPRRDRPVF